MKIKVNDEEREFAESINVTELLRLAEVQSPDMVSVQLNGEFVKRDEFSLVVLNENDEVDFLYFMGGGAR